MVTSLSVARAIVMSLEGLVDRTVRPTVMGLQQTGGHGVTRLHELADNKIFNLKHTQI